MRRELAGENSEDEVGDNATRVGRRKYGPGKVITTAIPVKGSEFEERADSDEEAEEATTSGLSNGTRRNEKPKNPFSTGASNGARKTQKSDNTNAVTEADADAPNPFLAKAAKAKKGKKATPVEDDLLFTFEDAQEHLLMIAFDDDDTVRPVHAAQEEIDHPL